ncbi:MAG: TonB-dependent receptor, partial [Proteobacteria bacterium]|nr:TonB-dependent receptor [Pseudomonadota bacterium]
VIGFVRAKESVGGTPLPRIAPFTVQIGAEVNSEYVDFRAEVDFASRQTRIAANETPTNGYTSLNTSLSIRPFGHKKDITIRIQGRNLTNDEIRYHTSFLKDVLPAPGRSIRVSIRGGF